MLNDRTMILFIFHKLNNHKLEINILEFTFLSLVLFGLKICSALVYKSILLACG